MNSHSLERNYTSGRDRLKMDARPLPDLLGTLVENCREAFQVNRFLSGDDQSRSATLVPCPRRFRGPIRQSGTGFAFLLLRQEATLVTLLRQEATLVTVALSIN